MVLMELSVQLHSLGAALNLGGVPREQNVEADALTSEDFSAFDAAKRARVVPQELGFQVTPQLMEATRRLLLHGGPKACQTVRLAYDGEGASSNPKPKHNEEPSMALSLT